MPQKYSIHAEQQSLFAFLKEAFFKMPSPVRIFAYLVFLFLFSFLTLYEFLGVTYYEGRIFYVSLQNPQDPNSEIKDLPPPRGMRVFKDAREAFANERGQFVIGIRNVTVPLLKVNFDFYDPTGSEMVPIPSPLPLVSLFNPNERAIYYVPGNKIKEADGSVRHYFLDRREAHNALQRSVPKPQPAKLEALPVPSVFAPAVVYAAEPDGRSYYLALRQLKISSGRDDTLDVYFEVRIDGAQVSVDGLPSVNSSELSRPKISRNESYSFDNVIIRIPETANHVEVAAFQRSRFLRKDLVLGSVGIEPRNTGVGQVTLSDGKVQLGAELFPPVCTSWAVASGRRNNYIVAFGLDIPPQYLGRVRSVQYDLGPGFDKNRIVRVPEISSFDYFTDAISIYSAQPISTHVVFEGGGFLDLRALLDIKPKTPTSAMEHYLMARALANGGDFSRALEASNSALHADSGFVPALIQTGSILAELERYDEALTVLRRAMQLDVDSPDALNSYAWLIADKLPQPTRAQLEDARLRSQQAISILPDPNYYDTLGWVQFKSRNYREALEALRRARKGQEENSVSTVWQVINFHLAMTYVRLGKNSEATEAFQQVVDFSKYATSREGYVRQAKEHLSTLQARLTVP